MTNPAFILVKKLKPDARIPERATDGATGYDLYACLDSDELEVGPEPVRVPTGVAIETLCDFAVVDLTRKISKLDTRSN